MRRRALLGLLGTTLSAGCATLRTPATDSTPTPAPVPSDTPSQTPPPQGSTGNEPNQSDQPWSLVEFRTHPVTVSLTDSQARTQDGGEVAMQFAQTATESQPALVRGVFRNANPFENTFHLQALPLFQNVPAAWPGGRPRDDEYTYRDELVLAPTGQHELAETVPELTLAADNRWRIANDINGPWFPDTHRLEGGESVQFEYALVGRPEGQGFPRGRYHFQGYDEREVVVAVWSTDSPGPDQKSRFEKTAPEALPDTTGMAWAHTADPGTTVYLLPTAEHAELPTKVRFTLVNHSREAVSGNPYFWRLWKQVDGQWFHVAPSGWPMPLMRVRPGGTSESALAAFPGHAVDCEGARSVGHLSGGRYAYEIGIGREDVTHAALIDFEAPRLAIEPTAGLDSQRDDGLVRVKWPRREDEVPDAKLTLTRAPGAETRLIPEQVMQPRNVALRNTVAFMASDVDRVRLITDRNTVSRGARTGGYDDGEFRFRLRGQAYEAAAQFGNGS